MTAPQCSVIVPTYNGAHKLPTIIQALEKQTFKDFELIIAIDGSTDNTVEYLNDRIKNTALYIRMHCQANAGRASIRNAGAKLAQSNILIFFDDDMEPHANCVQEHFHFLTENINSISLGYILDRAGEHPKDFQSFRKMIGVRWQSNSTNKVPLSIKNIGLSAANLGVGKEVFINLKGFDERLSDAEDYDFGIRAFESNIQIVPIKNAVALHNDVVSVSKYIKRLRQYNDASKTLSAINPNVNIYRPPIQKPQGIKKIIYNIVSNNLALRFVFSNISKLLIPKKTLFFLYDLVITGLGSIYTERIIK